ncbi:MAG: DUF4350 domain-containing protein [Thermoplasmatota archaeon]
MGGSAIAWLRRMSLWLFLTGAVGAILGAGALDLLEGVQQLSAYDEDWNDLSLFRSSLEARGYSTASVVSTPVVLGSGGGAGAERRVLVVVGVERPYLPSELDAIVGFVERGGGLLLADDFGYGGALAERLGASFSGRRLWSPAFDRNPAFVRVNASLDGSEYAVLLNEPTALDRVTRGDAIAWSDGESWLDSNSNGERDLDEGPASYPVVAWLRRGYGSALLFSDPGAFINDMWRRADNSGFVLDCVKKFFPEARELIFDESRHKPETLREGAWRTGLMLEALALSDAWGRAALVGLAILALLVALSRVRTPVEWHHEDSLYDLSLYHLAERRFQPQDKWRLRLALLDRLRVSLGLYPEEFSRLGEGELSRLLGDERLMSLIRDPDAVPLERMEEMVELVAAWRRP